MPVRPPETTDLQHMIANYDPAKAHEYYLRNRKLKGRKKGSAKPTRSSRTRTAPPTARARQRKELQARIENLEKKLAQLETLIRKKEHEEASEDRKSKAKKERAAKDKDKPKTAAEKAEAARENKKYRDKHKQELKTDAKTAAGKSEESSTSKTKSSSAPSSSDLKKLATRVRGQVTVAKQKLAAL